LGTQEAAAEALEAACVPHGGQTPDAVFLCAGKSTPGFFIEQTVESMRKGMDDTYWLAAWSAMVRNLLGLLYIALIHSNY
jgi:3-dehydrosphinganine reductase